VPLPAERVERLLAIAARAPSILNTQPWEFAVTRHAIELHADITRRLRADVGGREMLISCGAALFGLRLGIAELGYRPVVRLLPDPGRPNLLAKVSLGEPAPATDFELTLLKALPHRYTHRGPFVPGPLPPGLLIRLQHDAVAEHAALALIDSRADFDRLAAIVTRVIRRQAADENARADALTWTRLPGSLARDGVPASAIPSSGGPAGAATGPGRPRRLMPRDLDLGRGLGQLPSGEAPAASTAVLLTQGDTRTDWLRAGQALHRLLAHAASQWVFATMHSQALELPQARAMIGASLRLPGALQVVLEFGLAESTRPTPRRSPADVVVRKQPRRGSTGTKVPAHPDL
jgi:nitroreductase